jgi:hypothetical protein
VLSALPASTLTLAVLGSVFDVSAGEKHYGAGGGYEVLAGRDASRCYATGVFSAEEAARDLADLSTA